MVSLNSSYTTHLYVHIRAHANPHTYIHTHTHIHAYIHNQFGILIEEFWMLISVWDFGRSVLDFRSSRGPGWVLNLGASPGGQGGC